MSHLVPLRPLVIFSRGWYRVCEIDRVPTSSWNHGKPGKSIKKSSMHGKTKEFEKNLHNHGKIMEFGEIIWRTTSRQKTGCRTLLCPPKSVRQLVFWLLVVSSFNYFKMHAWSTSMLHSAFMLSVVKMLLKLKGRLEAMYWIIMEITLLIMENHGKIMELCFWISVGTLDRIISNGKKTV